MSPSARTTARPGLTWRSHEALSSGPAGGPGSGRRLLADLRRALQEPLPSGGVKLGSLLARLVEILICKALADCDDNQTRAARLRGPNGDPPGCRLQSDARDPS